VLSKTKLPKNCPEHRITPSLELKIEELDAHRGESGEPSLLEDANMFDASRKRIPEVGISGGKDLAWRERRTIDPRLQEQGLRRCPNRRRDRTPESDKKRRKKKSNPKAFASGIRA
jgi:hypothetical protein